jgi:AcrR family transcriptional regulator
MAGDRAKRSRSSARESARPALLDRALTQVSESGLGDTSLRSIAKRLGTSHRMLIYHFGSAEEFWDEVVGLWCARDQSALLRAAELGDVPTIEEAWERLSSERYLPIARLIFEIYPAALRDPGRYADFRTQVVDRWLAAITDALVQQFGIDRAQAQLQARIRLAVMRGLLLDLLTTGDRAGTTAALQLFAQEMRFAPAAAARARRTRRGARGPAAERRTARASRSSKRSAA